MLTVVSSAQDATHSSGWIVIPSAEYGALRARAYPAGGEPDLPAPVEATLTRVDYDLQINNELATGRADLTVDVLKDGWVRVPVPAGLLVREARLEGKLVSLVNAGGVAALLQKRGRSVLALQIALPISAASGVERLTLPASSSGVTRAAVKLARLDMDVRVTGGFLAQRAEAAGESQWLAYGRGNEALAFTWKRRAEDRKVELPLRQRGSLTQLIGLGEDSSSMYAEVNLEVQQGASRQVRIEVPPGVTVNQVLGATVADWEVQKGELLVHFLEPVEKTARLVVTGDGRLPRDGSIAVPLLRLLDVERESGGVAVEVIGAGELKDVKSQGLEGTEASELGSMVASRQSPSLAAFRLRAGSGPAVPSLTVQVARYEQQAVLTANVEEARYRVLLSRDGKTLVEARYAVRNNQRNFVKIAIPAGAVVWSAAVEGRSIHPGKAPDGGLLFPLTKSKAGEDAPPSDVMILYQARGVAWAEKGRIPFALPGLDLPVSRTGVQLFYPPSYKVQAEPGTFRVGEYTEARVTTVIRNETPPSTQSDLLQQMNNNAAQAGTQALIDKFRARVDARRPAAEAPAALEFPAVGPSLFLVSELTGESQTAQLAMSYQRDGKGGVR